MGQHGPSYYVTHAPCRNKYVGKLDSNSLRHQRSFRLDRSNPEVTTEASILKRRSGQQSSLPCVRSCRRGETVSDQEQNSYRYGKRARAYADGRSNRPKPVYRDFKSPFREQDPAFLHEQLPDLFARSERGGIDLRDLDREAQRRLLYCAEHKINFISGTMSPADKDLATGELESLARGLDYYKDQGIEHVVLQPKYMGSRCGIYLFRDLERCYAASRNGYRISGIDLSSVYERSLERFSPHMQTEGIEMMLLDGELRHGRHSGKA